jgi:hypothetical protein
MPNLRHWPGISPYGRLRHLPSLPVRFSTIIIRRGSPGRLRGCAMSARPFRRAHHATRDYCLLRPVLPTLGVLSIGRAEAGSRAQASLPSCHTSVAAIAAFHSRSFPLAWNLTSMIEIAFRRALSRVVAPMGKVSTQHGLGDRGGQGKRPAVGPAHVVGWIEQFADAADALPAILRLPLTKSTFRAPSPCSAERFPHYDDAR